MKRFYDVLTVFFLFMAVAGGLESSPGNDTELTGKEIISLFRASLDQIKTIEADCIVSSTGNDKSSGFDLDSESNAVIYDYHWYYDFDTEKEYQKGKGALKENGTFLQYRETCRGYDGDILYSYSTTSNSGLRRKGKWDQDDHSYFNFSTPLILLGMADFASDDRTLYDVLKENSDSLKVERQEDGSVTISCVYRDYGEKDTLVVTFDPQHGYLPKHLETYSIPEETISLRIDVTDFTESSNGIWFPVRGRVESYSLEDPIPEDGVHYKNGMTEDEIMAMTMEERWEIAPELGFRAVLLAPPGVIHVNPSTLKINEPFDESLLTLEKFPDGVKVWDDILRLGYVAGRFDDPNYVESKKTTTGELVFRIVFITIGCVIVFSALGLILKKRFAE
ncbi:MAG: hypothetical protein IJG60_04570 [Thermoguttaceae bacterium]|nr:hypothetical protein [Thermoguttaceae bacterium]